MLKEESLLSFTFSLLSIHGELAKMEGGAPWCTNSRMKDDVGICVRGGRDQNIWKCSKP
jgi:hypothetical protein